MFRLGLLATFAALILTSCVSTYGYRSGDGGDYYYAEPSIDYYDGYGRPYGSIGYGYPGGWYGSFGYGFGYTPYSRYGFPYGYDHYRYGYPYSYYPYPYRRPPHHRPPHHRPPGTTQPPGTQPPNLIVDDDTPPGDGPRFGDRDDQPWRERARRRIMAPQPGVAGIAPAPGAVARPSPRRIMVPQPGMVEGEQGRPMVSQTRRMPMSPPQPTSQPQPRREIPRAEPAPMRRIELQERESRRDPER
jgi:hypothetical protein